MATLVTLVEAGRIQATPEIVDDRVATTTAVSPPTEAVITPIAHSLASFRPAALDIPERQGRVYNPVENRFYNEAQPRGDGRRGESVVQTGRDAQNHQPPTFAGEYESRCESCCCCVPNNGKENANCVTDAADYGRVCADWRKRLRLLRRHESSCRNLPVRADRTHSDHWYCD
jgi:hypothetical protein